jgi:hypothetical protein
VRLRVRVEIMGSPKCRIVGESQSVLMMINPIIFTRTRSPRRVHTLFSAGVQVLRGCMGGWGGRARALHIVVSPRLSPCRRPSHARAHLRHHRPASAQPQRVTLAPGGRNGTQVAPKPRRPHA